MVGLLLVAAVAGRAAESFNGVYLSEVLVENARSLADEAGQFPSWIELVNGGSEVASLNGWFLSDSPTNLAKWRFPRVSILPGGFMVVFASGRGSTNDLNRLHANFTLAKEGGFVALSGPGTNLVAVLRYPKSEGPDVSYGRVRGEPALLGNFAEATPGRWNAASGSGFAPPVVFSRRSGSCLEAFPLALSCPATNAVIRYTLDGRLPGRESPAYQGPLTITNTMAVRARAYQEGLLPGPPGGESYIFLGTNLLGFQSSLPVLVLDTFGVGRSTSARSSFVEVLAYEPADGKTSLTNAPALATRGGFHQRGSSSSGMPQPGFALQFLDEFDHEQHLPFLGLPANSDWVLYAPNYFDPVMIHNPFIHQLSRDMGRYSPRTRFVEVYLAHHGGPVTARDYFGVYVLEEKIKVGKHRVAIDRLGAEDLKGPEVTGGYLLKFDRLGPGESGFWAGGASMVYVEPKEPVIELPQRAPQRAYLKSYFDEFERVLDGPRWKDPVKGYRAYIDVEAWIDFHVLEVLSGNVDIFNFSTYFYKPRGGKIVFGPHWDFDRALGSIDERDADPRRWNTGRFFDAPWWSRLFMDPDFWQLWVDKWQGLRQTTFSEANLFGLIDRLAAEVREAQPRQARRWGLEPRGGSYQSEVDWMKTWLRQRMEFIDQQLAQPPKLGRAGGKVPAGFELTLNASGASTIYYTLDGSDPRQVQGGVSTNAVAYAGPIVLKEDVRVMARVRNPVVHQVGGPPISTPWSSPVRAEFKVVRP